MAKGGRTLLCLLVLAAFADFGLGFNNLDTQVGTIQVFNSADYDITILNKIHYVDGHTTIDPAYTPLLKSTQFDFQVMQSMDTVWTLFSMQTNAPLPSHQLIVDWSSISGAMKVPCLPNCFWVVDNNGFSVAATEHAQLQFVTGWD